MTAILTWKSTFSVGEWMIVIGFITFICNGKTERGGWINTSMSGLYICEMLSLRSICFNWDRTHKFCSLLFLNILLFNDSLLSTQVLLFLKSNSILEFSKQSSAWSHLQFETKRNKNCPCLIRKIKIIILFLFSYLEPNPNLLGHIKNPCLT